MGELPRLLSHDSDLCDLSQTVDELRVELPNLMPAGGCAQLLTQCGASGQSKSDQLHLMAYPRLHISPGQATVEFHRD